MTRTHSLSLAIVAAVSLSACSSNKVEHSGFLHDYSVLSERQSPSGKPVLAWVSPALARGRYTQVYLAPSQFYPSAEPTPRIPLSTLAGVTDYYDAALRLELGKVMQLVNQPGPNTLVVRPAITQVATARRVCAFMNGCR